VPHSPDGGNRDLARLNVQERAPTDPAAASSSLAHLDACDDGTYICRHPQLINDQPRAMASSWLGDAHATRGPDAWSKRVKLSWTT
jgi:hypothetical protein